MYLTQLANSPIVINEPIGLSNQPTLATNDNVSINSSNNGLIISNPGIYKVRLQANLTSTGTEIGAVLYANGTSVAMTSVVVTLASGDDGEVVIEYPVVVTSAPVPSQALVQFYALSSATLLNGFVTVERIS